MSTPDLKIIEAAKTVYGLEIRRVDADFECGHDGASFKFEGELVQTGTRCSLNPCGHCATAAINFRLAHVDEPEDP